MASSALPLAPGPLPEISLPGDAEAARIAKALAHPVRIRILRILRRQNACYCGDLCQEFDLAQSTISQHLKVLREAGLIRATPCGTSVGYCADEERLAEFQRWTSTLTSPSSGYEP
jgi:DNA-binding transcriptional ArsR family regulator